MKIAFLGIGAMGSRIAQNLMASGYELQIWNRTLEKCKALEKLGAKVCDTPAAAVKDVDVAIAMVTDDRASEDVWLNQTTGAITGLNLDTIVLEYSTLTPHWCRKLAADINHRGCEFLDAPVVGSRPQAEAKALIHLVGGRHEVLEKVREVVAASSSTIHHIGEVGMATTLKLAVNTLFAVQVASLGEVLGVLSRGGMEIQEAVTLLNQLPTTSPALKGIGLVISANNYSPLFPIDLVQKDLSYAELANSTKANTPLTTTTRKLYQEAIAQGYGEKNIAAVAKLFLPEIM